MLVAGASRLLTEVSSPRGWSRGAAGGSSTVSAEAMGSVSNIFPVVWEAELTTVVIFGEIEFCSEEAEVAVAIETESPIPWLGVTTIGLLRGVL
jgi:hypothetical protein